MRTKPPYYSVFVSMSKDEDSSDWTIVNGNCSCPTGLSQSCVHLTALLLTVIEISPLACTSLPCLWSRPSGSLKGTFMENLRSKDTSYIPYEGRLLDPSLLLERISALPTGQNTAAVKYFKEMDRSTASATSVALPDPLQLLKDTGESRGFENLTVEDVIRCVELNQEQRNAIEVATRAQHSSTIWIQARQWRVTASKFGVVCNRPRRTSGYPPSLVKGILGDYGTVSSPALTYGRDSEAVARCTYESVSGNIVEDSGLFIHSSLPYIGATPDGVIDEVRCSSPNA